MALHGIDISHHQGNIDYETVKNSGKVDFLIIKAGGSDDGFYEDSRFREYLDGFKTVDIPVLGAYYFVGSGFVSTGDGIADADRFCDMLDGTGIPYAILDLESTSPDDKDGVTDASIAFMDRCVERGYKTMIYASDISGFQNRLELDRLYEYKKWVARYGSEPQYVSDYAMWQYSSSENIEGIPDNTVDCNYLYDEEIIANIGGSTSSDDGRTWTREQAERVTQGLYSNLLFRDYSNGENEALVHGLEYDMSRWQAFLEIYNSDECQKKLKIVAMYLVMRGQLPSREEVDNWFNTDNIHEILYSDEFNNNYGV